MLQEDGFWWDFFTNPSMESTVAAHTPHLASPTTALSSKKTMADVQQPISAAPSAEIEKCGKVSGRRAQSFLRPQGGARTILRASFARAGVRQHL